MFCVIDIDVFNYLGSHIQFRGVLMACLLIAWSPDDLFAMRIRIVVQSLLCFPAAATSSENQGLLWAKHVLCVVDIDIPLDQEFRGGVIVCVLSLPHCLIRI